jgi:hypothetical protein
MNPSPSIRYEDIAVRAHQHWDVAGKPDGQDTVHWLRAERELHAEHAKATEIKGPPRQEVEPPAPAKQHVPDRAPHSTNYVHPGVTTDSLHHRRH